MTETIELASSPPNRQATKNQDITGEGVNWRQFATTSVIGRQTDSPAHSHRVENTQLASLPSPNGKLGTLASSFSLPVCHTRKGGKRQASPANCRTGSVRMIRFTLALLDDPVLLERSRKAESRRNGA